jgi:hypothetical protein
LNEERQPAESRAASRFKAGSFAPKAARRGAESKDAEKSIKKSKKELDKKGRNGYTNKAPFRSKIDVAV